MTVIDGHNLYFALDRVDEDHFESGLQRLVDDCRQNITRGTHILVLDGSGGKDPRGSERQLTPHLRLVHSGQISADDWIIRWMMRNKPGAWTLVSADRRLYEKIRHKGCSLSDPQRWFRRLGQQTKTAHGKEKHSSEKKNFGTTDEWLNYFNE
jgi:hypothetical protein